MGSASSSSGSGGGNGDALFAELFFDALLLLEQARVVHFEEFLLRGAGDPVGGAAFAPEDEPLPRGVDGAAQGRDRVQAGHEDQRAGVGEEQEDRRARRAEQQTEQPLVALSRPPATRRRVRRDRGR